MSYRVRDSDSRFIRFGSCENLAGETLCEITSSEGEIRHCEDTVGNRTGDNPFYATVSENRRWILDGEHVHPVTGGVRNFRSCPIYGGWTPPPSAPPGFLPETDLVSLSNYAWQALANTNLNRSELNLPAFIGELKDLPSLVKDWGGGLLRKIAKGHISWRWAINPMISDLRKLANFADAVSQRTRHLKRLQQGKEVKQRTFLGASQSSTAPIDTILHSESGAVLFGSFEEHYAYEMWATTRYRANSETVLPPDDNGLRQVARNLTYGVNTHSALEALWELTPWSWFIDWFAGIGTVMAATNNTISMSHSDVCVMCKSTSRRTYSTTDKDFLKILSGENVESRTDKSRYVTSPVIPFVVNFPIVDRKKWSILASLVVLRAEKPR